MSRRLIVLLAVAALLATGCNFYDTATFLRDNNPAQLPWWCTATAWGPGHGDHYAGQAKSGLSWNDCAAVSAHFDRSLEYAEQYPTSAAAQAAGMHADVSYAMGMGTHHRPGPSMADFLADPNFDRFNPVFPGTTLDDVFTPDQPDFLQYDTAARGGRLVGMSWFVRTDNGMPPAGFEGDNDWWHSHEILCFSTTTGLVIGQSVGEAACVDRGGLNIYLDNYWMVHAWIVGDMQYPIDVFENHHPCLPGGGAIFTPGHPCRHQAPTGGGH